MNGDRRNIRRGLAGRAARLRSRLARARHFRGHGVHSPFVYALVREVFMRRRLPEGDRAVFDALLQAGISYRRAVELQCLFRHCGYATFGVNCADAADLCVLTREVPEEQTLRIVHEAAARGNTVCLMGPYDGSGRTELCRRIVEAHASTSVDNRGYLLLFNNHLPKQHFCI